MGRTGQKGELPSKRDGKSKKPPPAPTEDDDPEDGDIATPKRDRSGDDDEPLSLAPTLPLARAPFARAAMQRHSWTNNRPGR